MATIDDVITYAQDQVSEAMGGSQAFINELLEVIGTESAWRSLINSEDRSGLNAVGFDPMDIVSGVPNLSTQNIATRPATVILPNIVEEYFSFPALTEARNLILNDLRYGGYGIHPSDENALWERERDREASTMGAGLSDFQRQMAARGFSVPNGAFVAGMAKIQQESRGRLSSVNREIAIKRSELLLQARQFAIQYGMNADQVVSNYHSQFHSRFFELLRLRMDKYNIDFRAWETEHDVQIKKVSAELELWGKKTQNMLDFMKLQLSERIAISNQEHEIATEGLTASSTGIDLYKSILESAQNSLSAIATLSA